MKPKTNKNKRKQKFNKKKTIKKYGGKKDILVYFYPRILQPVAEENTPQISKYINGVAVIPKENLSEFLNNNVIDVEEYLTGVQQLFKKNPNKIYPTLFYNDYTVLNKNEKGDPNTKGGPKQFDYKN